MMLAGAPPASAQEPKATGVVAVRQSAMDSLGGHSGAIQKILTEYPELINLVPVHARAIAEVAPTIPAMFPQGSTQEPTRALPAIWEKQADFENQAKQLASLADAVVKAAEGGDRQAILQAFTAMGRDGCGGCHNTYREKQN
jgi:cytochrome c556